MIFSSLLFPLLFSLLQQPDSGNTSCCKFQKMKVEGTSMEGIVSNGDTVLVAKGYYECNEVKRNDLVIYHYGGMKIPLIKAVYGMPGDSIRVEGEHILINGNVVLISNGTPYVADSGALKIIKLYEQSYQGIIPKGAYLILGNRSGTTDSGRFGFAGKQDIIGRA